MTKLETKILAELKKQKKVGLSLKELIKRTGAGKARKTELIAVLNGLEEKGELIDENGRFLLVENLGLDTAEIVKVNATFGFAKITGIEKDVFIPGRQLCGAMPGDIVLLKKKKSSGQLPECEVFRILKENNAPFSGTLEFSGDNCFINPDSIVKFPVKAAFKTVRALKTGDKVLAQLVKRGTRHSEHIAAVIEGFGSSDAASSCCASILAANDIYTDFPPEVLEQAKAIAAGHGIHPKELAQRMDLRDELIFTMDGADTKDIDDAVSLKKTSKGWQLGVHIADVSYYVTHKTPIDSEAYARGTSVYYADSVVPMLPKELSNGICSLNPGEDRLAFSAIIELDSDAKIDGYEFKKTVIKSRIKGVYSEINALLEGSAPGDIEEKYKDVKDILSLMLELSQQLTKNRYNRGGVNLESVESKIILDDNGKAVDIKPRERGVSELMIEEFMLVANQAAARLAIKENLPFVYRVHERPAPDKLALLFEVLDRLGVSYKRPAGRVSSAELTAILDLVKDSDIAPVVNTMVLRSMAKAKYSDGNIGHFGLALDDYTHFTSPIRRYPDLTIHRILSAFVTGMRRDNINKRFSDFVGESSSHSTAREIAAMVAERECEDAYKAEYMKNHIGEEYDAIISSIMPFGCYVRLANTVEGLVRIQSVAGDWQFDGVITFENAVTGEQLRLGDKIRVKAVSANVSAGQIDFEIVNIIPTDGKTSQY